MKVSLALHRLEPDMNGNQRVGEARYGGYNRVMMDLVIDPNSGAGIIEGHNIRFPNVNTDPETFEFISIAREHAPEGYGGAVINYGKLGEPIVAGVGYTPTITMFGMGINPERMKAMHLIVQERTGAWREKSEAELRATMDGVR